MSAPVNRGGGRARSRIVIDVEQVRAAQKKQSPLERFPRASKILAVVALIVLGAAIGLYLGWQSYKKSPSYTVARLIDAAQHDDVRAVEELIDSDRVAEGFVPQLTDKLVAGVDAARADPIRRQIQGAMTLLLPRVRESIREEIARGIKNFAAQTGEPVPFSLLALSVWRMADVKKDGDAATADLKAGDRALQLTMQRTADARWKIVGVKDEALAADIAARLASSLPSAAPPAPAEPRAKPRPRPASKPAASPPAPAPSAAGAPPAGGDRVTNN